MFLHFVCAATRAVEVIAQNEGVFSDVVAGLGADVKTTVDEKLGADQYVFKIDDVSIPGTDKTLLSELLKIAGAFKEAPEDLKSIVAELSLKNAEDLSMDLKSGAYSFATVFTDDVDVIKSLSGAESEAPHIKFLLSTKKELAESLQVPFPGVLAYNATDKNILRMPYHKNLQGIVAAISIPAFSPISRENMKYIQNLDQKLFYIIDKQPYAKNKSLFNEHAKKCSGFAKFVFFTPEDVPALIPLLKLQDSDYPILLSLAKEGKGIVRSLVPENFLEGVHGLLTNTAEKLQFSSEIPADNETRNLKVVNTETLATVMKATGRDVLLAFVSETCRFCQLLAPELERFAKILSETGVPIFVGQYNVMENEEPDNYEINGVPTLYFMKAGSSTPVKLPNETRTVPELLAFVAKEGLTSKIDMSKYSAYLVAEETQKTEESGESDEEVEAVKTGRETL